MLISKIARTLFLSGACPAFLMPTRHPVQAGFPLIPAHIPNWDKVGTQRIVLFDTSVLGKIPNMKRQETQIEPTQKVGLRSARAVVRDRGISDVTLWRWIGRGWLKAVNICGRNYIDLESLAEFDRRAANGDFSKAPAGAAGASSTARAEKERQRGGDL